MILIQRIKIMNKKIFISLIVTILLVVGGYFIFTNFTSQQISTSQEKNNTIPKYGSTAKNSKPIATDDGSGSLAAGADRAIVLGWDFYEKGDLDNAMRRFNQAWLLSPNNPDIYWGMGSVEGERGHTDSAISLFSEGLEINPRHTMLLCNLGFSYTDKARDNPGDTYKYLDKAIVQFETANKIDSNVAYCHAMWAVTLFYQGKYSDSWEHVHKVRSLGSGDKLKPIFLNDLSSKMRDPGDLLWKDKL